ncbi:unnamed protein product [Protopolystoma xenopodis]|uniref:Leucine carboxyl methyltransferase 1 n=1 Tax=Protopolystoma xenopodis TaxID=117903 RepID=A0A3S5CGT1_9PLAT|nr:unnamed protein product [Protopolystoma xenopodis]
MATKGFKMAEVISKEGTNDEATMGKAHAVKREYWKDPYLKIFCTSSTPRAPEISRGYFVRVQTFKAIALHFSKQKFYNRNCQIVNLGAGSDTLFFQLNNSLLSPLKYLEIDLRDNIRKKKFQIKEALKRNQFLTLDEPDSDVNALSNTTEATNPESASFYSGRFQLVEFDLRFPSANFVELLTGNLCQLSLNLPTLFLAECVLVYMPSHSSMNLLKCLSSAFKLSAFLHYEQVNMSDRFGLIMAENFRARSCNLPGLDCCESLFSQEQRCLCVTDYFLSMDWLKVTFHYEWMESGQGLDDK